MEDNRDPNTHPKILQNENPEVFSSLYDNGVTFLQNYGWFLVFGVLILLYLRNKFKPQIHQVQRKVEKMKENTTTYDPDVTLRRQEAMDVARRRMQEKYDAEAARHAEMIQKKEEERRQQKIEDWDNHLQGKGYRSKYKPTESDQAAGTSTGSKPGARKNVYRTSDFSPLGGGGGGSSGGYRPARRSGGGTRGG